jgi:hypothetical protein
VQYIFIRIFDENIFIRIDEELDNLNNLKITLLQYIVTNYKIMSM